MSVLDFHNLIEFEEIWKRLHFDNAEQRESFLNFTNHILSTEKNPESSIINVLKSYPMVSSDADAISNKFNDFMLERKAVWIYASLAMYHKKSDEIIEIDNQDNLEILKRKVSLKERVILAPFHLGPHTMTIPLLTTLIKDIAIMINSNEIDIILNWFDTYSPEDIKVTAVPIPSQTSSLKFIKSILRGSTGVIFPEFSYGINQEFESVSFLGGEFKAPIGIYMLSQKIGATVFPVGSIWDSQTKKIRLLIGPPMIPNDYSQNEFIQELFTQGEHWILSAPEQWYWDYLN